MRILESAAILKTTRAVVMTTAPLPHRVSASAGSGGPHGRLARWAVSSSAVCGPLFAASVATVAIAYAVGAEGAVEDTWLGALLAVSAFCGALGSLAAFVLAIVAKVRREHWTRLWLPLSLFPAIVLFVLLGEAFWWE